MKNRSKMVKKWKSESCVEERGVENDVKRTFVSKKWKSESYGSHLARGNGAVRGVKVSVFYEGIVRDDEILAKNDQKVREFVKGQESEGLYEIFGLGLLGKKRVQLPEEYRRCQKRDV